MLREIADLLEIKDDNPFKIRAYTNAARSIETNDRRLAARLAAWQRALRPATG